MIFQGRQVDTCVTQGYETVIVNGSVVYKDDSYTDIRSGKIV